MKTKPITKTDYANFSLLITYTYPVAIKRGKKSQTHRDDITRLKFENEGMELEGFHPIEILYRKFLEEMLGTYCAIIFDNGKPQGNNIVLKVIMNEGKKITYCDKRAEYYDLESGYSFDYLISKSLAG